MISLRYTRCLVFHKKLIFFPVILVNLLQAADKAEANSGCINSDGDLFVGGTQAGLVEQPSESSSNIFHPREYYECWTVEPPSDALKHFIQHSTGWMAVDAPTTS